MSGGYSRGRPGRPAGAAGGWGRPRNPNGDLAVIAQEFNRLGDEFAFVLRAGGNVAWSQPGQHLIFGCFARVVGPRWGNTDSGHNDRSTQTTQPASGNKTFGADRPV